MERINEPIRVLAVFGGSDPRLYKFNWRGRVYQIESVNLFHISRDGHQRIYHFAVSSGGNGYELSFNSATLKWQLETTVLTPDTND